MARASTSLAIVVIALLSGCASHRPADAGDSASSGSAAARAFADIPVSSDPPRSSVLHILDPTTLGLALPPGGQTASIPVAAVYQSVPPALVSGTPQWRFVVEESGTFTGAKAHLFTHIQQPLTNPFVAPGTCAWSFVLNVSAASGQGRFFSKACQTDGPVIAAGDREFDFELGTFSSSVRAGDVIGAALERGPFAPGGGPSDFVVLAGTPEADSRIELPGLNQLVPTASPLGPSG